MRTIGSLTLCRSLLEAGLVDRFRTVVFPVITGESGPDLRWLSRRRSRHGHRSDVRLETPAARVCAEGHFRPARFAIRFGGHGLNPAPAGTLGAPWRAGRGEYQDAADRVRSRTRGWCGSRFLPIERGISMQDIREHVVDPERLAALEQTGLLDSEVEEEFDRLTRLASTLLGAPATFFSLVDEDRDFYKSCFGLAEPLASDREMKGVTFCHYSLVSDGALVIPDTRADPVYRQVPTVETLGVSAYLGVPVHAPGGEVLGSFCAIDFQPREWTPTEIETMKELAKSAEREIAVRHWMRRQRQLMEQEMAAREELERVVESRTRLMRGFTHDVKNPIGSADGIMALLEDGIVGTVEPEQREHVQRARRALRRALGLIDELVALAVLEGGHLEIRSLPVSLSELVVEMVEDYRSQAVVKGLDIRCEMPAAFPLLRTDETRVRQILGNLISNAIKYTEAGEVLVRLGTRAAPAVGGDAGPDRQTPADSLDTRLVAIDVIDPGIGISPDDIDRIFNEFVRLAPESTSGAGLGLAISQRLAQALGGWISATSEVGRTSTFTLWLPLENERTESS